MNSSTTSLEQLHDIVMPDPVSWLPLAPGWHVLLLALLLGSLWSGLRYFQSYRDTRYRREALHELESISPSELPALVKRTALAVWTREQVASLSGERWLEFLDQSGDTKVFTQGQGKLLLALSHDPENTISQNSAEFVQLKKSIRLWMLISKNN